MGRPLLGKLRDYTIFKLLAQAFFLTLNNSFIIGTY